MNAEYVEQQLEKTAPTVREKCLLACSFGGEVTDEAFHTLLDGLDIDAESQNYLLMLSCLGFTKGWERFPPEIVPRLKGIHCYHQAHVSTGIPWLVQQIRVLADAGIPVMLLKGVAVWACYAPGRPRLMGDYDFAVPEEQFDRALELLLDKGNRLGSKNEHSASLRGSQGQIDLHRWIFKCGNERFADIWERAETFHFHGVDVRVPAQEDMFLHLLDTQSRNYFFGEMPKRRMQWFYDCRDVWSHAGGLDLERLAARARELHTAPRIRMMLRLFMRCFPELIKQEEFERYFPRTREYDKLMVNGEKYKTQCVRYREYGYTRRSAMTPIRIWRGLRLDIASYRYLKPELRWIRPDINFFRFIGLYHGIDSFSDLAKGYLSRIRLFEKRTGGG